MYFGFLEVVKFDVSTRLNTNYYKIKIKSPQLKLLQLHDFLDCNKIDFEIVQRINYHFSALD